MPPSLDDEVTYLSGVDSSGHVAATTYAAWNSNSDPASYETASRAAKWGSTTAGTSGGTVKYVFDSSWSATEQTVFKDALALFSAVANINFTQVASLGTSDPGIRINRAIDGTASTGTSLVGTSGAGTVGGTKLWDINVAVVLIDPDHGGGFGPIDGSFTTAGGYPWTAVFHELGHAVGLGHGGPYDDGSGINPATHQYSPYDSQLSTVMSYNNPRDAATYSGAYAGTNWGRVNVGGSLWSREPTSLMSFDILALQRLYGLPTSTPLSGGQVFGFNTNISNALPFYNFNLNTSPVVTIWDAGNNNALDLSGYSTTCTVNLNPGTASSFAGMTNNLVIAFKTAIDKLTCGSGNDAVTCNNNGDTIIGYYGNDVITGGTGFDTAIYSQARANYAISRSGATTTVTGPDGTDTLTGVERLTFSDTSVSVGKTPGDFNRDGIADILWQNSDTGQVSIFLENGTSQLSGSGLLSYNAGPDWHAIASGDFNGDGSADILWQNSSGQPSIWFMDGTTILPGSTYVGGNPGADWKEIGAGDFNGDGKSDILWQNTDGSLALYFMDGTTVLDGSGRLSYNPGPDWHAIATGDFNGDGKADILFQNSNGQASIWMMNGSTVLSGSGYLGGNAGPSWKVTGSGDFNEDGKSDVLWQNTGTGQISIYLLDGTTVLPGSGPLAGEPGPSWQAKGTGDLNGDGAADIIWQNATTGQPSVYFMAGTSVLSGSGPFGGAPGPAWHLIANSG